MILQEWHEKYIKLFRDSLAHGIPLYMPPSGLNEEEVEVFNHYSEQLSKINLLNQYDEYDKIIQKRRLLGKPIPLFTTNIDEEDYKIILHGQIISDFLTIEEVINRFINDYELKDK